MTKSGRMIGLAAMLVVAVGGIVPAPAQAGAATDSALQAELDELTHEEGFPGALATVTGASWPGGAARHRTVRSGVGDLSTGRPVPYDGRVRIGSNNKTVVATVVLQLVEQGAIGLDAPVERYLPGLVRGNGNDGRKMRIRHLLQHTSGVPDFTGDLGSTPEELLAGRFRQFSGKELLDMALAHPPTFQPGEPGRWAYSNTGYELLGMVIEKVTGHSWQHEVAERVIKPLRLDTMYLPGAREYDLRGPHPRGYLAMPDPGGPRLVDITEFSPSLLGVSGVLVSTPRDYNRFLTALLEGDLLSPGMLAEMKRPVPTQLWPGAEYGLGLIRTPLSCGGYFYGHSGDVPGYTTMSGLAVDAGGRTGRSATVALTRSPITRDQGLHLLKTVETALCSN
ncbi:serine hydrolase domain-containing protein [Amycolatopsis nigrescens]|uniref:serine hydrolase domain-containing protein n=1 Tax=Amycolatopsis nigrescens TaxID=381445 RepID=UPI00036B0706|nr:serine hydrolase domain-containing protein [Amycolatopsis nigrescens]